jgi:ABC-type ATPase involved in cell division
LAKQAEDKTHFMATAPGFLAAELTDTHSGGASQTVFSLQSVVCVASDHVSGFRLPDLLVQRGEWVVCSGPAACGKSRLVRVLAGLETPQSGAFSMAGENLIRAKPMVRAGLRLAMGIMLPEAGLLIDRSVQDNVAMAAWLAGRTHDEGVKRARSALTQLGWRGLLSEPQPSNVISQSEQRLVLLARALVNQPAVLLLDDFLDGLDDAQASQVLQTVDHYVSAGVTAVVTQRAQVPVLPPRPGQAWPSRVRHLWLGQTGGAT